MAAAKYNITIEQGADFEMTVTLTDANGTAIDISAGTITFISKIRRSPETDTIQSGGSDIEFQYTKTDGANGEVKFYIEEEKTRDLPGDNLYYDIYRKNTADDSYVRDLEGKITVIESIAIPKTGAF